MLACMVMAYILVAYVVMAYVVLAYIVMACMVMAYIVVAYVVMACMLIAAGSFMLIGADFASHPPSTLQVTQLRPIDCCGLCGCGLCTYDVWCVHL